MLLLLPLLLLLLFLSLFLLLIMTRTIIEMTMKEFVDRMEFLVLVF